MKKIILCFILILSSICAGCLSNSIFTKKNSNENFNKILGEIDNKRTIFVTGKGLVTTNDTESMKSYLLAERAAIIDGYRLLTEKIAGLLLQSYSVNKNFKVSKDMVMVEARSFVKGAEIMGIRHLNNGIVEVDMRINITQDMLNKKDASNNKTFDFDN